jgi:hypothetical protein
VPADFLREEAASQRSEASTARRLCLSTYEKCETDATNRVIHSPLAWLTHSLRRTGLHTTSCFPPSVARWQASKPYRKTSLLWFLIWWAWDTQMVMRALRARSAIDVHNFAFMT